jgi:hypothetical protein
METDVTHWSSEHLAKVVWVKLSRAASLLMAAV